MSKFTSQNQVPDKRAKLVNLTLLPLTISIIFISTTPEQHEKPHARTKRVMLNNNSTPTQISIA